MKYQVSISGKKWEVEVDGDQVVVNGDRFSAVLSPAIGTPVRRLSVDGRAETLAVESRGSGEWLITRLGERVEVGVLDERTAYIRSLTASGKSGTGGGTIKAPMPGMVVKTLVEPGQTVQAGVGLVVLEAMKMENELKAAAPGVVAEVLVRAGQVVEKGQALVVLSAAPS